MRGRRFGAAFRPLRRPRQRFAPVDARPPEARVLGGQILITSGHRRGGMYRSIRPERYKAG